MRPTAPANFKKCGIFSLKKCVISIWLYFTVPKPLPDPKPEGAASANRTIAMGIGFAWLIFAIITIIALIALPRAAGFHLQCVGIAVAIVMLLTFEGCARVEYDAGGSPVLAMAKVSEARSRGEAVEIRGTCNSSCALKLAAGSGLCVSPQAEIGVHEVRRVSRPGDYQGGVRDDLWTGFFEGMLPSCARDLFNARHGFASGQLAVVSGNEILRACPTIRACAPQ